ncbi:uncharacterized protein LOC127466879 [Manacus candei]|uniref:uncharacterized protein LOC127466879 n=1 Tax=Manacus candei TaxID=415023 RepID=UPI00222707BD|nr:uncharacterized protein LOC127466879 [Manacus candei]
MPEPKYTGNSGGPYGENWTGDFFRLEIFISRNIPQQAGFYLREIPAGLRSPAPRNPRKQARSIENTGEDDLDMLISPDRRESSPGAPQIGLPAAGAAGGAGAAGAVVAPPGPAPAGQAGAVGGLPGAGMAAPGGVGISGGAGSGAAGAAPSTISTGLAAMATSTGAGTVGVTGLGPSPAAAAATGAGATAALAGGAGAVPTGGASVLTDLGGGAGAAPFPTPSPPEGEASILGGGGRKEEPREFPISASHEKGTETHRQGKPIPTAERREKRGLPPFDKDTEVEGELSDNSGEGEADQPVVKPKGKLAREVLACPDPVASRTRAKDKPPLEAPLRQAVTNQGTVLIKAPFSLVELQQWKDCVGAYRDNPEKMANYVQRAIKSQNPDWNDLEVMMDTLLDQTEKEMVKRAAQKAIEIQKTSGQFPGEDVKDIFPLTDPGWDPNVAAGLGALKRYQDWVIYGFRHGVPKAVNWSKMYEVRQDINESPTDFLNRLKDVIRKYTDIDLESEMGKKNLLYLFIGQSTDDIRRKLQKAGGDRRNISELLDVAWTAYQNREQKRKTREQEGGYKEPHKRNPRYQRSNHRQDIADDRCSNCKKKGHWRRDCPELKGTENALPPPPPPAPQLTALLCRSCRRSSSYPDL